MCGAVVGGLGLEGVDTTQESVIQGVVVHGQQPVGGAYVRLLDRTGEFAAEVPTSATGQFRFFAAPGDWTVRILSARSTPIDRVVKASRGGVAEMLITV
ncbi:MAG: DUF1416 domain-containing protein [Nocardioidaceae bacterium]